MSSSHENETFLRYLATVVVSVKRRSIGFSAPKISCLVWAKKGQLRRQCSIVSFSPHLSHSAGRIFSLPLVMKCLYLWCMSSSSEFCEDCFFSALTSFALAKWGFASLIIHLMLGCIQPSHVKGQVHTCYYHGLFIRPVYNDL